MDYLAYRGSLQGAANWEYQGATWLWTLLWLRLFYDAYVKSSFDRKEEIFICYLVLSLDFQFFSSSACHSFYSRGYGFDYRRSHSTNKSTKRLLVQSFEGRCFTHFTKIFREEYIKNSNLQYRLLFSHVNIIVRSYCVYFSYKNCNSKSN